MWRATQASSGFADHFCGVKAQAAYTHKAALQGKRLASQVKLLSGFSLADTAQDEGRSPSQNKSAVHQQMQLMRILVCDSG